MYWAVRQICMAKHLRSRGWWGGWFTGQGENVHNGWLSLRHYRFTYTLIQLLPGLIDHRTFSFSTAPESRSWCVSFFFFFLLFPSLLYQLHDPLLSFLLLYSSCPTFTARALHKKKKRKSLRGHFQKGGSRVGRWGFVRGNRRRPPLWGRHLLDRIHWE